MLSRKRPVLTLGLVFTHLLTSVVSLMGPAVPMAEADTTTVVPATNGTAYTPFNPSYTSPTFQVAQAQSLANLYGSCFSIGSGQLDPLVNSITQLTTGKAPGGVASCANVKTPCNSSVSNTPPRCNRSLEPSQMKAVYDMAYAKAGEAACCVKAKESQLQEALKELSCISEQNDLLANQIGSMQSQMQQNFQSIEQNLSKIETVITDRKNQLEEVNNRLHGGPGGRVGLLNLKKQLDQVINAQLPQAVKSFNDAINGSIGNPPQAGIFQQQEIFQQRVKNKTTALAKQCMSTTSQESYLCSTNSEDKCSFAQLIEAKYYELLRKKNKDDQSNLKNSRSKKAQMDALFNQIFSDMSSDIQIKPVSQQDSQNPQDQQSQSTGTGGIQTPLDLQTKYGSQLAALSIEGLDVQTLFQNKFAQCYQKAQATVEASKTIVDSDYSKAMKVIEKEKQDIRDGMGQFLQSYGEMYKQVYSEFGVTLTPLDLSKCTASTTALNGELQCVKDLQTQLTSIYNGSGTNSSMTVQLKGNSTDPITSFNFTCAGVDGCITTMQNLVNNLNTENQKLTQTKKTFIMQANQSLESFKGQMAQVLSIQNQALQNRLTALKKVLAANGVTDPLTTQSVQKRPLEKDENGLYKMPEDLLATIGGDLKPPLIDPASGSFDNARSSIAHTIQENEQKGAEAEQVMAMILNEQSSCSKRVAEELNKKAENAMTAWTTSCGKTKCSYSGTSGLQSISVDVDSIRDSFGINDLSGESDLRTDFDNMLQGIQAECGKIGDESAQKYGSLKSSCEGLDGCSRVKALSSEVKGYCTSSDGSETWYPTIQDPDPNRKDETNSGLNTCNNAMGKVKDAYTAWRNSLKSSVPANCDKLASQAKKATEKAAKYQNGDTDSGTAD